MHLLTTLHIVLLALSCGVADVTAQKIELVNNGYKGVLIAISESVPETPDFIDNLKAVIDEASETLYLATKRRAFFEEVTILLPSTWTGQRAAERAKAEIFEKANIRIDQNYADPDDPAPWVIQPSGCGEPGQYMIIPPLFITDRVNSAQVLGSLGKALVHEWGHLRWGLFDEYPEYSESDGHFYINSAKKVEATKCNRHINGLKANQHDGSPCKIDARTLLPDKDCRFYPFENQTSAASFMYLQHLQSISSFCDDDGTDSLTQHNRESPSQHNRMCNGLSAWSVMKSTADFSNGANPARDLSPVVRYKVISHQIVAHRVVICVESSERMNGNRHSLIHDAVIQYILDVADYGTRVGFVRFSSFAVKIASTMVELTDDELRLNLAHQTETPYMPNDTGTINIHSALEAAKEILEADGENPAGGRIIMVTYGEDSLDILDNTVTILIANGIIVDLIVFTDNISPTIKTLAESTGGTVYCDDGSVLSTGMIDAFRRSNQAQKGGDPFKEAQLLFDRMVTITSSVLELYAVIDSTLGVNSTFTFRWIETNSIDIILTAPNGTLYRPILNSQSSVFKCPGICPTGKWDITARYTGSSSSSRMSIQLTSLPKPIQRENDGSVGLESIPITISTSISNTEPDFNDASSKPVVVFAIIMKGSSPVIGATVAATLQGSTESSEIPLLDNGAGADINKNDGIYSGYILNTGSQGKHIITVNVMGGGQKSVRITKVPNRAAPIIRFPGMKLNNTERVIITNVNFTRHVVAGFIDVQSVAPSDGDAYPPSRVTDLRVTESSYESGLVSLSWTAVGDDLTAGTASSYELYQAQSSQTLKDSNGIRVDESSLHSGSFSSPSASGTQENITLSVNRNLGVIFYGLVVRDDDGKRSNMSNIVSARLGSVDLIPPAKINDLRWSKSSVYKNAVTLRWTAVGDDGLTGTASLYELYIYSHENGAVYDESNIHQMFTPLNESQILMGSVSSPKPPFSTETFVIKFEQKEQQSIAVFVVDKDGLRSPPSNVIIITPFASPSAAAASSYMIEMVVVCLLVVKLCDNTVH